MKATDMTQTELEIMEALWAKGEPLFLGELLEYFNFRTGKRVFDSSITQKVSTGRIKPVFFCQIFCCNI